MNDANDSARAMSVALHAAAFGSVDDLDAALEGLTSNELNELHRIGHELSTAVAHLINSRTAAVRDASRTAYDSRTADYSPKIYTAAKVEAMRCNYCRAAGLKCLVGMYRDQHPMEPHRRTMGGPRRRQPYGSRT